MRELKFKVWHEEDKQMIDWLTLSASAWNTFRGTTPLSLIHDVLVARKSEFVKLLYTGLKDKNGVEIYEGDILEYTNEFGRYHIHNVFYKEGGLVINSHNNDLGKDTPFYSACADMQTAQWIKQCEVIGNVFENPELLESKRV